MQPVTELGLPAKRPSEYETKGEYHWFLSRLEPVRASDGTLPYWIGMNLDIEEVKRAEEQRKLPTMRTDASPPVSALFSDLARRTD
jgi:hypothetical protein